MFHKFTALCLLQSCQNNMLKKNKVFAVQQQADVHGEVAGEEQAEVPPQQPTEVPAGEEVDVPPQQPIEYPEGEQVDIAPQQPPDHVDAAGTAGDKTAKSETCKFIY